MLYWITEITDQAKKAFSQMFFQTNKKQFLCFMTMFNHSLTDFINETQNLAWESGVQTIRPQSHLRNRVVVRFVLIALLLLHTATPSLSSALVLTVILLPVICRRGVTHTAGTYVCLAVTWPLHCGQNDRDFSHATSVTRGLEWTLTCKSFYY